MIVSFIDSVNTTNSSSIERNTIDSDAVNGNSKDNRECVFAVSAW